MHFNNGFSFGCVIYHRFLYRLQKIVILKSNYCQGKFHLFFAIEHAQKLKSLVEVAENPCWEWNFRAECPAKNLYTSMTRPYWSWTVQTDDWRWNCSWFIVRLILALPEWIFFQHYSANSALHKGFLIGW